MGMFRAGVAAVGLVLAMLVASAHAQQTPSPEEWNKVVDAAKKEGKVVLYHSQLGAPFFKDVIRSFESKYGIDVEEFDARASEMTERMRTEQATGRYVADITLHSTPTIEFEHAEPGPVEFQPHGGVPNMANLRDEMKPTALRVPAFIQALGVVVNTRAIPAGQEPKSWKDFLDPKWRGKILMDDPRPLGSGGTMFFVTTKAFGKEFQEQLAAQKPVFSRDLRDNGRRVARGEYPITLPIVIAFASDLRSLPVKIYIPEEGAPYTPIDFAMLKNAPHPNAARMFINHFLDMESQVTYANAWMLPVIKGVEQNLKDDYARSFVNAKLLGQRTNEETPAMQALAKDIYKDF